MAKIFIVEDEEHLLFGLRDNIEFEGYEVDTASNGNDALQKILKNNYDLILLDVMLPGISGFEITKAIRKQNIQTPVIFLTAKTEEIDKVIGLESGGDDYISKPFSLRELLARIKAVLRRSQMAGQPSDPGDLIQIGKLKVNFNTLNAFYQNDSVKLSLKEFEILRYLWEHKNSTVSRDKMLDAVWGYDYQPTGRTIDNFILKLRQKIEDDPNDPHLLITIHGIGYKLNAYNL